MSFFDNKTIGKSVLKYGGKGLLSYAEREMDFIETGAGLVNLATSKKIMNIPNPLYAIESQALAEFGGPVAVDSIHLFSGKIDKYIHAQRPKFDKYLGLLKRIPETDFDKISSYPHAENIQNIKSAQV
jgi:hypothetical protein